MALMTSTAPEFGQRRALMRMWRMYLVSPAWDGRNHLGQRDEIEAPG